MVGTAGGMRCSMKSETIKYLQSLITDETPKKTCDLLQFAIRCVREHKVEEKVENKVDWLPMFETLWKMYPRKVGKQNAVKQFEHKVRGLSEEECREKCNLIYLAEVKYIKQLQDNDTPLEFTKHFASFLNAEVPNSKYYKGR